MPREWKTTIPINCINTEKSAYKEPAYKEPAYKELLVIRN